MGTLGVFTQATSPDEDKTVFGRILAGVMRGNAMVQGQTQAKKVASDQMNDPQPVVTMKANPNGGAPLVTVKDITADALNPGQQANDVKQAYDTPHANVEKKLNDMGIGSFQNDALQSVGYKPHRTDITPEDMSSFSGQRAAGTSNIFEAAADSFGVRHGIFDAGRMADNRNRMNAMKNAQAFKATVQPEIEGETQLMQAGNASARLGFEKMGAERAQRKEYFDRLQKVVDDTDYSLVDPKEWRKATEDQFGSEIPDFAFQKVQRKADQDIGKSLDKFTKASEQGVSVIGSYPNFDAAKQAFGRPLSPQRETQLKQTYDAAHNAYMLKDQRTKEQIDALRLTNQQKGEREQNADDIADGIMRGDQPPDMSRLYGISGLVRAKLARQGYDLTKATQDWTAAQQTVKTLNGSQQVRLRQAVDASYNQLDQVQQLYDEWKKEGAISGLKAFNKASLATAKNLPGKAGAAAQALEGQISLLTGELGNTLMGGNSPTDHALSLSKSMLDGSWNEETFKKAIGQLRVDLNIRKNSLIHTMPSGGAGNQYAPKGDATTTGPVITDEKQILGIFGKKQ